MKSPADPIKTAIAQELSAAGFTGRSPTWHKQCPETILVVGLQKSQYGPQYYINLGVWVRQLGDLQAPKESQCHLQQRATSLPTEKARQLERALDLEDPSLKPLDRETIIREFMRQEAIPFLTSLSTLAGIRAAIEAKVLRGGMVPGKLEELLARGA